MANTDLFEAIQAARDLAEHYSFAAAAAPVGEGSLVALGLGFQEIMAALDEALAEREAA